MLTHDPKLDDAVLLMALRSDATYIGAMGSKRAQNERRERLMEHGVTEEELARISAPVGLDLGATGARETALSIMAECVAVRHGRDGGRLCKKGKDRKRIHAEAASGATALAGVPPPTNPAPGIRSRTYRPSYLKTLSRTPLLSSIAWPCDSSACACSSHLLALIRLGRHVAESGGGDAQRDDAPQDVAA